MLDEPALVAPEARSLIERKLAEAEILLGIDLGENIARIGSRVVFRINDSPAYERTLVLNSRAATRADLPVCLPRGLALLGLAEGQTASVPGADAFETVYLDAVLDGARREPPRNTAGQVLPFQRRAQRWSRPDPDDDPGPSAA